MVSRQATSLAARAAARPREHFSAESLPPPVRVHAEQVQVGVRLGWAKWADHLHRAADLGRPAGAHERRHQSRRGRQRVVGRRLVPAGPAPHGQGDRSGTAHDVHAAGRDVMLGELPEHRGTGVQP